MNKNSTSRYASTYNAAMTGAEQVSSGEGQDSNFGPTLGFYS